MKKAIYEIWSIAKAEEVDLGVAVNMFSRNCQEGDEQYIGTGEYDYKSPVKWGKEEMRVFNTLYNEKGQELCKAFTEGNRELFEAIVEEFYS